MSLLGHLAIFWSVGKPHQWTEVGIPLSTQTYPKNTGLNKISMSDNQQDIITVLKNSQYWKTSAWSYTYKTKNK